MHPDFALELLGVNVPSKFSIISTVYRVVSFKNLFGFEIHLFMFESTSLKPCFLRHAL